MSAGGISYSGLQTKRRVTLPSVEMWGNNMNILKDPNVGVFTRRKDKVGDTQNVLMEQDDSGDRAAEYIQVYARGVNPMVSVSYNNVGNNGGQTLSCLPNAALSDIYSNQGGRLPYQVETFRPPILRQEDLLPLSRMPRVWFHAETNPQFPDFLQSRECNQVSKTTKSPDQILRTPAGQDRCGDTQLGIEKTVHPEQNGAGYSKLVLQKSSDGSVLSGYESSMNPPEYTEGYSRDILRKAGDGAVSLGFDKVVWDTDSDKLNSGIDQNPLHVMANTASGLGNIEGGGTMNDTNRDKNGGKEIDRNRRIYEAFSNKSVPSSGPTLRGRDGQTSLADPQDSTKSINSNLLYMQAQTNNRFVGDKILDQQRDVTGSLHQASRSNPVLSVEGFQLFPADYHGLADQLGMESTVIPTKRMVYAEAQSAKTSIPKQSEVDSLQSTGVTQDNLLVRNVRSNITDSTRRENVPHLYLREGPIEQNPVRASGRTNVSQPHEPAAQPGNLRPETFIHSELRHYQADSGYSDNTRNALLSRSEQDVQHHGRVFEQPLRVATESTRILPGADLGNSVMFSERSGELSRTLPTYSAFSTATGRTTQEADRADLRHLDRRSLVVENTTTAPENPGTMAFTDVYSETQTRDAKGGIYNRPNLGGFLHNASARPLPTPTGDGNDDYASLSQNLFETSQGHTQKQSTTDDRVKLRRRAFDEFMGRSFVPPPPEYTY